MVVGEVAQPVDVLVIGGGPGGYTAAARAQELGKEVTLVERDRLGGVCLNVGCIPSKALIGAAHDLERARRLGAFGVDVSDGFDLAAVQRWKQEVVDDLVAGVGRLLAGVDVVAGTARFLDGNRVAVESADHVTHYRFDDAIVATGSRPVSLPGLEADGDRILDSTAGLALEQVPGSLVVVGGGYVGLELAMAYAKFGSRVTIVEAADRLLSGFDAHLVREVERGCQRLGITVHASARVEDLGGDTACVRGGEEQFTVPAEKVLVAVGRVPNTADLQLEEAGLEVDGRGLLAVDDQRRTKVPHVFAIGDVTEGPALAHKAMAEGRVAAEVIAGLPSGFDQVVPLIAFTDPELASVGLTEEAALAEAYDVAVARIGLRSSGRAATLGEREGTVKLVADRAAGTVLGVHIAGAGASELIGEATLAVETAARVEDVAATVHPHPTLVESIAEVAARLLSSERRKQGS